jgi:hypothetical protein
MQTALTFSSGVRTDNHPNVRFSAAVGEELEAELALA